MLTKEIKQVTTGEGSIWYGSEVDTCPLAHKACSGRKATPRPGQTLTSIAEDTRAVRDFFPRFKTIVCASRFKLIKHSPACRVWSTGHIPQVRIEVTAPQGPHSHILMMGGSDRGSYFISKKIPTSEFVYPKKSVLFLAYPKKSLSVSKFYYLSSEITESATQLCTGS